MESNFSVVGLLNFCFCIRTEVLDHIVDTYTPVPGPLPDYRSRVEVQILQIEVTFDFIGKVFVFLRAENDKGQSVKHV